MNSKDSNSVNIKQIINFIENYIEQMYVYVYIL